MKIFLHVDDEGPSQSWHSKFKELLNKKYLIPFVEINLSNTDTMKFLKSTVGNKDLFIGRIRHSQQLLNSIKPIYDEICDLFKEKCFPCRKSFFYYDDKRLQLDVLNNYPFPKSSFIEKTSDIPIDMKFPVVCKKTFGASSKNVFKANKIEEIDPPCIIQEFCKDNDGDVRITIIGNRGMGYLRKNRPNDFRASGSGLLSYPSELPIECLKIAHKISKDNGFESMAYDFVKNNFKWQVLEFSYTYIDKYILDCKYYYDMTTFEQKEKIGVYPEEMILDDFLSKVTLKI